MHYSDDWQGLALQGFRSAAIMRYMAVYDSSKEEAVESYTMFINYWRN